MREILCVLFIAVIFAPGSFAGEPVSLNSLVLEALENNPDIRAARARWEASAKRPKQEGTLPDPMIGVDWQNVTFDEITLDEDPNSMVRFSFSQEIPFPGKLSLKEKIASTYADAEGKAYLTGERKVVADLKAAYYDWYLAEKAIRITERNKELLGKFTEIAKAKYEVGKGIQQDVIMAGVESSKLIEQVEVLRLKKEVIEAGIKSMLGRPQDSELGSPGEIVKTPLTVSPEEAGRLAGENAPLLAMKESQITGSEEALKLAQRELYPDFVVGVSPGVMGREGNGVDGVWEVSLGLKVPLYFWRKQNLGIEEAALELKGAQEEYRGASQSVLFSVRESYLSARTAERLMELYENGIIPQSKLALESALTSYQTGSADFLTLLNSLVSVFSFELEYERNLAEYQKAVARIEEYSGIDLTRQSISKGERK